MTLKNITLLSLLSICYLLPQAAAETDVKGTIQYRQNYMTAIGGHTGAIRRLKDGRFTAEGHLQMHTEALAPGWPGISPCYFPRERGQGKPMQNRRSGKTGRTLKHAPLKAGRRHKPCWTQYNPAMPGR